MAVAGVVAERIAGILPVTWDALSKDTRYGETRLRQTIDYVKYIVLGKVVAPTAEAAQPLTVVDYIAKVTAIELCTAGIDFWMNEPVSESATGTNEQHAFVDRVAALEKQRARLVEETRRLAPEIADLVDFRAFSPRRPLSSTIDDEFLTPSPQEFPRPFQTTDRS